ncbi:filamentous haemagglutinin family protein [Rhodopseudomonas sp. RCAM05734]|uniref:filamentous haemagglutinin family protein n=1 Tax=Rhodopseudomonas sp. RCAM05734 TaxID=3457549 RepID=UPI004043AEE1
MTRSDAHSKSPILGRAPRPAWLFAGVSAVALLIAMPDAGARPLAGGPSPSPSQAAIDASQAVAAGAAQAARKAQDALSRATGAILALQQMQAAARDAAAASLASAPSGIVNGLRAGGLDRATGADAVWIGAGAPTDAVQGDRIKVDIVQTQKNAVLTWRTFNIGEKTDLSYNQQGNRDWVALNRVIDPALAPSRILGTIKADGTVLVINPNGIIFGAGSQINVGSLIASTLDVGPSAIYTTVNGAQKAKVTDIAWRNQNFLQNGLLGYDASTGPNNFNGDFSTFAQFSAFSVLNTKPGINYPTSVVPTTGTISVGQGASIVAAPNGGLVLLTAPQISNAGRIVAPAGQVLLAATGSALLLTPSTGAAGDAVPLYGARPDPNVRGLVPFVQGGTNAAGYFVWNQAGGLIETDRGNITLVSPNRNTYFPVGGASYNDGTLSATTSVSRNGSIAIDGSDVRLGSGSLLSILPDRGGETIPQDPTSLSAFKPSAIKVGDNANNIEMQSGAFLFAPGANVQFGASAVRGSSSEPLNQTIVINAGAEINVAGLTDVQVPINQVQIVIDPAKKNELRDSPLYRDGFLNGATIYLDPRRSGVRADGVAWIGSPLIDATAYYQLVGLSADRLMTKGGNVAFGPSAPGTPGRLQTFNTPNLYLRAGSVINASGGWASFAAGTIRTTRLLDQFGRSVDIGDADPSVVYVGIANGGFTRNHAHWGFSETWADTLRLNGQFIPAFTEGRDAGVLTATAAALIIDSAISTQVYAGKRQLADSKTGSGTSSVAGDLRAVQSSNGQLPAGGALIVNGISDATITHAAPAVPDSAFDGWTRGTIDGNTGTYVAPTPVTGPVIPASRASSIVLTDGQLSNSGLSQVSLSTLGKITVESGTSVTLNAGGLFQLAAGRRISVNGDVTVPSGRISLETAYILGSGTLLGPNAGKLAAVGDFDISIAGDLSVAGQWVNEYTAPLDYIQNKAWLNGGAISIKTAANILQKLDDRGLAFAVTNLPVDTAAYSDIDIAKVRDISGSILVGAGSTLNLSGGGRVDRKGNVDLAARGGNLSLSMDVSYYQTDPDNHFPGFQVDAFIGPNQFEGTSINPDRINAHLVLDPTAILAHGLGGGGTFTLVTPEFALGTQPASVGAVLPFDFFSTAGFAKYNITSTKTELTPNTFNNGIVGNNALLAVQTITIGAGQTLALQQSMLPNMFSADQSQALLAMDSGGDVNSLLTASVAVSPWDQRAVSLVLGGALELRVAQGGSVTGAAGSSLTVGALLNEGSIRIAGGSITQQMVLPRIYALAATSSTSGSFGIHALSDIFTIRPDGKIYLNDASQLSGITNLTLAANRPIYKVGVLDQGQGMVLATGSVTDLSGSVILNQRAVDRFGHAFAAGAVVGGGSLAVMPTVTTDSTSITSPIRVGGALIARPGALLDLSGAAGAFDVLTASAAFQRASYVSTPVWSDAGTLSAGAGGTLTGAIIRAQGGSAAAQGGTLQFSTPIFTQHDPSTPMANVISADMIAQAGFDTFVAMGNITSRGDARVVLDRAFFLLPKPLSGLESRKAASFTPVISTDGALAIEAPYIALQNQVDQAALVTTGTAAGGSVTFRASQIDIAGTVLFDKSVTNASFNASGDIRLTGVVPWQVTYSGVTASTPSLRGMIAINGDLALVAGQIYPTTGTSFAITSAAANGTIAIGRSGTDTPAAPYSAGGNLLIQAANIIQGGVVRVPFGTLTLGSNAVATATTTDFTTTYAPATKSVVLAAGSVTSVSANGLSIPYGTTTDTMEWYFAPTVKDALTAPPTKVLSLNAGSITLGAGATIDLTGGGDVYAYEFVPGTGGSRDVLSQFNSDQYSANKINGVGYQYPDGRQVYAIVPGVSNAPVAAYDPIYSANYASLTAASEVGKRVYLSGGNGVAAGWYTLLPAQYAMLPGGMRVVEQTGAKNVMAGLSVAQADGSLLTSGYYGDALSGGSQSQLRLFSVQSQDTIRSYSKIVLTSGNNFAIAKATSNGTVVPRTGLDAGRLVLNPITALSIDATVMAAAAPGGRGAQVDISGSNIDIVSSLAGAPNDGAIHLTAAGLNRLNAESLLIGGIRTDNADGTTSLALTARTILVANDAANPLVGPEILFAVDDGPSGSIASSLTLNDGATIVATGALSDQRAGAYVIDGTLTATQDSGGSNMFVNPKQIAIGALVRVANGPQRVVQRLRTPVSATNPGSPAGLAANLNVGNATLQGNAIGLDTSHNASIASGAQLRGQDIAFGAGALAFTSGSVTAGTLAITPQLLAVLSQGSSLTLRSQGSIGFDDGSYSFGAMTFDAATLESRQGGAVAINATRLQLANSGAPGAPVAGTGALSIAATEIWIGSGTLATANFASVSLAAANGMFSTASNGVIDVGSANLALIAPYIGDRAVAGTTAKSATAMTLRTTGAVNVSNAGTTAIDVANLPGIPGSSLTIAGNGISIAGTRLRATAGSLTVAASGNLVLSNGAVLEAPGYSKTFGDAADPQTVAAPGGTLALTALGSTGITLGDALLSVGGGSGNGGNLKLATPNGAVDWGTAVLNGKGGVGGLGGRFSLDSNGGIDLVAMNDRVVANGFTGGFDVRTRTGDIKLTAGQVLKSGSVKLTADGGLVKIAGTIDTSGVNGGDIELYGVNGVTLERTARLDTHASGYAADDTRQAKAGNITLGTDFLTGHGVIQADGSVKGTVADSGSIQIDAGAAVDASASRPGNRLVRIMRNGTVNYQYVQGDQGGIVSFRAPVVTDGNGKNTVNVSVASAGSIKGARAIDLEGFKRWDLAAVAASGLYSGVTRAAATNAITLDLTAGLDTANADGTLATVAGLNFLGDNGAGTVVEFVRGFDVSAAYGNLGGLDAQANFNARPGVELKHDGNITLASNWNLGAGTVNVTAAKAAGAMATDSFSGQDYVVAGREADLLANYTTMTYRVGGKATGAAPLISLRAGGDLHLQGSLTDGFFQFRDQYDATYQSYLYAKRGTGSGTVLNLDAWQLKNGGSYVSWQTYLNDPIGNFDPNGAGTGNIFDTHWYDGIQYIDQLTQSVTSGALLPKPIMPFSVVGNSPAAQGAGAGGAGDPLASAVVMPLLPNGKIVASSDYRLTAGAAMSSADPLRIAAASAGNLIVDGPKPSTMSVSAVVVGGGSSFSVKMIDALNFSGSFGSVFKTGSTSFLTYLQTLIPGLSADAAITLQYASTVPTDFATFINQTLAADPNAHVKVWTGTDPNYSDHQVTISVALFSQFLQQFPGGIPGGGGSITIPLLPQTVVRTGTGSIRMAAAGNVDLTGGSTIQYIKPDGSADTTPDISKGQLGGAVVYTAGHPVASISEVLPDPATGAAVQITALASATSIFSAPPVFTYGLTAADGRRDIASVVIADTMQLVGGGDIGVTAQGDVLGRRDLSFSILANNRNASWPLSPWIGKVTFLNGSLPALAYDQPWRIGSVTQDATTASINPQLFRAGIGALGGGNIRIDAGGKASDILAVADTSLVTGVATPANGSATKVLLTMGGGNVAIRAGSDILGARIDAPSGAVRLSAGGTIGDLPVVTGQNTVAYSDPSNHWHWPVVPIVLNSETHFRIDDATVDLAAGGRISVMGIGQLDGFYSDRSALNMVANGAITVTNTGMVAPALTGYRTGAYAIYPGTLTLASLLGDVNLRTLATPVGFVGDANKALPEYNYDAPSAILLTPSTVGQLGVFAGGNIAPTQIAMLDSDPYYLPGLFTLGANIVTVVPTTRLANIYYQFDFPQVIASKSEAQLERLHNAATTHAGDATPVTIYADGDIGTAVKGVTLSVPKQARIEAGRDIVNMVFFGQNLSPTDVTRIVAGRDLIATTTLAAAKTFTRAANGDVSFVTGPAKPAVQGNTFILGGPGDLMVEAGRNMGPFLNSAEIKDWNFSGTGNGDFPRALGSTLRFGEGIITVGNDWNPYLPAAGANITVQFGTAKGANYDGLRDAYVAPGTAANALGDYGKKLVDWMKSHAADVLKVKFGTGDVTEQQAYQAFLTLPELRQRLFLINEVYFDELRAPSIKGGPSYLKYSRGYAAVNTLFPASLGYTANGLEGGANDGAIVHTGDLDLRLAAIETINGGNINILGPGGRVLAGSVVSTAQQAARRNYAAYGLQSPQYHSTGTNTAANISSIEAIPPGYEGVLTQRGGSINTFTDGDFLLNQSRLFTVKGGDITMWSSNADLNAGQGAKTTPNFPPVQIRIGENLYAEPDQAGSTSGAGIAALPPDVGTAAPNVYLLAPRGAVDAGDAGVRSAGNLSVAALRIVNADNFKVSGATTGLPTVQAPNITGLTEASNTAGAAAKQAETPSQGSGSAGPSVIIVEVLGYGGGTGETPNDGDADRRRKNPGQQSYDASSPYQVLGVGELTDEQVAGLAAEKRASAGIQ